MQGSPCLVAAHVHEHASDASRHLVRRCTDVGDSGRKAGLIGCLRFKHVAVRGHRHERGDEVVRGGANERALPRLGSPTGRMARPVADHATVSPQKAEAIGVTRFAKSTLWDDGSRS